MTENKRPTATAEAALQRAVAALETSGAHRFNPVRFSYIKALANRSREQGEAVADLVAKKAWAALRDYKAELSRERAETVDLVAQVAALHPQTAMRAQSLLEAGDFPAARRLVARRRLACTTEALTSLVQCLEEKAAPAADCREPGTISELLRRQEAGAVKSTALATAGGKELPAATTREFGAAPHLRDALQRQRAEQLVTRVLLDAPEDAGPLNPQKLATRSLAALRDLSPAYLGRFVAYVDTLFWLEKAGGKNTP